MSTTTVPGMRAKHEIVTAHCRLNHTNEGAAWVACGRLVEEYMACLAGNPDDTRYHFVLTVDRTAPRGAEETNEHE